MLDRRTFLKRLAALSATLVALPSLLKAEPNVTFSCKVRHAPNSWTESKPYVWGDLVIYRGRPTTIGGKAVMPGDVLRCTHAS